MPLGKQNINLNFGQGLDTKTDPNQVQAGKFINLVNSVFNKGGLLQKRNGFQNLQSPTSTGSATLTTLNDSLLAIGTQVQAYSPENNTWTSQGFIQPADLSVVSLTRTSSSQTSSDSQVSPSGLCCSVSQDSGGVYYQVLDATTGQSFVKRTLINSAATQPRVSLLNNYFVITYILSVAGQFNMFVLPLPIANPASPLPAFSISTQVKNGTASYDCTTIDNTFYVAYDASDVGGATRVTFLTGGLVTGFTAVIATHNSSLVTISADSTAGPTANIYVTAYDSGSGNAWTTIYNFQLLLLVAPAQTLTGQTLAQLTSVASNNLLTLYLDNINHYGYSGGVQTDFLSFSTYTFGGTVVAPTIMLRGLGLAAKPIVLGGNTYLVATYGQTFQPTYFIINTSDLVVCRLAYENGRGYLPTKLLPSVNVYNNTAQFSYLFASTIIPTNKSAPATGILPVQLPVLEQYGVNLAAVTLAGVVEPNAEIANTLHIGGGYLWMYDQSNIVEHNFLVFPEDITVSTATGSGNLSAQTYFYQFTYEWTDAQGNIHRSAPSVPVSITTTTSSSTNTLHVATLRITQKQSVRIVGYRWSQAQQVFYQFTSQTVPTINDPTIDFVTFTDSLSDAQIIGNAIIYTTGGVVEDIAAPATDIMTLYQSRLFLVDAEDRNLIWFSKQVIEAVPVEMSDLFTIFVAPTQGAQGSTGPITALSAMDDKLIIFKKDAIYYMTGSGPDNTGANNDFSPPTFITSTVGCNNPRSLVLMPNGIMFQSDKGIWLLGRDLSTSYIGAPVETFNNTIVLSALTIPGTNQVRFHLDSGVLLMYDYYYDQWGTFANSAATSAVVFQGLHTYLNRLNIVRQETPGFYVDGSTPVLMSFTTAWLKLTGLQHFQRAYWFFLLGNYVSPHFLNCSVSYDFNPAVQQTSMITPVNQILTWGLDASWGASSPWGGSGSIEQFRVFLTQQKCQAIQINAQEVYDASHGIAAGAGLTLSGLNLVVSGKLSYPKPPVSGSVG